MMPVVVQMAWKFFKTWFLPQPPHDEQFPVVEEPAEEPSTTDAPLEPDAPTDQQLESAEEMERRAAREPAPDNLNLNEFDFSDMVKPPEGSEDRSSRSSNPFSRSKPE